MNPSDVVPCRVVEVVEGFHAIREVSQTVEDRWRVDRASQLSFEAHDAAGDLEYVARVSG